MITNVRIGNDIKLIWQILKGGQPVDLTGATDVKVSVFQGGNSSCGNVYIDTFKITDAVNGILSVEIPKEVITEVGYMWTVLEYTLHDDDMIDGDRKVTVDNVPVRIVSLTAEASQVYEFNVSSDILAGFHGKSAFEVWLTQNPDKTEEDYFNWLQKPATDAVSLIDDKIEHLDEVIETSTENESERVTAENTRKTAEATRISAETERKANEVERLANETSRASDELIREANESSRKQDEATRKTNENEREIAETTRVSNENNRVTAEQERVQAESLRATAESSRELAESLRVEAELLRQSSTQEAILNAENATESANTAAQNADDARLAIQDDLALKANHGYASIEVAKTLKEVEENASLVYTYRHSGNKEIYIDSIEGNTFTSVGHGLKDNDFIAIVYIQSDSAEQDDIFKNLPVQTAPTGYGHSNGYLATNITENTFELVGFTLKEEYDLSRFRFEVCSYLSTIANNLPPSNNYRIVFAGNIPRAPRYVNPGFTTGKQYRGDSGLLTHAYWDVDPTIMARVVIDISTDAESIAVTDRYMVGIGIGDGKMSVVEDRFSTYATTMVGAITRILGSNIRMTNGSIFSIYKM